MPQNEPQSTVDHILRETGSVSPHIGVTNDLLGAVNAYRGVETLRQLPGNPQIMTLQNNGTPLSGAVTGGLGMAGGVAGFMQGLDAYRNAQSTDDRVNAGAQMASSTAGTIAGTLQTIDRVHRQVITTERVFVDGAGVQRIASIPTIVGGGPSPEPLVDLTGSVSATSTLSRVANTAGVIGSGIETTQGLYNTVQGLRHYNERDTSQQLSDGVLQLGHGGLSMAAGITSNPVLAAAAGGLSLGGIIRDGANAAAEQNGTFGANQYARADRRGSNAGLADGEHANSNATDAAANFGVTVQNATGSSLLGGIAAAAASPVTALVAISDQLSGGLFSSSVNASNTDARATTADDPRTAPLLAALNQAGAAQGHAPVESHESAQARRFAQVMARTGGNSPSHPPADVRLDRAGNIVVGAPVNSVPEPPRQRPAVRLDAQGNIVVDGL